MIQRSCAVLTLVLLFNSASAQTGELPGKVLLAFKACAGQLRVFENGAVVETRRGQTTQRQLTESQLRKLREVIERRPCQEEWKEPAPSPSPAASSSPASTETKITIASVSSIMGSDCFVSWLSGGTGLDEIQVTLSTPEGQSGPFPVYTICDGASEQNKKLAKKSYPNHVKPNWQKFIADVSKTVGSKSFLKGCDCWR